MNTEIVIYNGIEMSREARADCLALKASLDAMQAERYDERMAQLIECNVEGWSEEELRREYPPGTPINEMKPGRARRGRTTPESESHAAALRRQALEKWDSPLTTYEKEILPTNATPEEIDEIKARSRGMRDPRVPAPAPYFPMSRAWGSQTRTG